MPSTFVYKQDSTTKQGACKNAEGILMSHLKEAGSAGLTRAALRGCLQNSVPAGSKQSPGSLVNYLLDSLKKNGAIIMEEEGLAKIQQRMRAAGEDYRTAKQAVLEGRHYARVAKVKEANLKKRAEPIQLRAALMDTVAKLASMREELQFARDEVDSTRLELASTRLELASTRLELASTQADLQASQDQVHSTVGQLESAHKELESAHKELESAHKELESAKRLSDDFEASAYTAQATNMGLEDQLQNAHHQTNVMRGALGVSLVSTGLYFFVTLVLKVTKLAIN